MRPLPFALLAGLGATLAGAVPAWADSVGDCLGLGPAGTPTTLRAVRPGPRVPVLRNGSDRPECPADTPACRTAASFGPNNRVVVGAIAGAAGGLYACATRTDVRGHVTAGWIPAAALAEAPAPIPFRAADWTGSWHGNPGQRLRVTATLDGAIALAAESNVAPPGVPATRPPSLRRLVASLRPDREGDDTAFTLAEDGTVAPDDPSEGELCRMTLARRGPYLVVQENGLCGAGFTALYRRG